LISFFRKMFLWIINHKTRCYGHNINFSYVLCLIEYCTEKSNLTCLKGLNICFFHPDILHDFLNAFQKKKFFHHLTFIYVIAKASLSTSDRNSNCLQAMLYFSQCIILNLEEMSFSKKKNHAISFAFIDYESFIIVWMKFSP
jgi:hypothetical protein